MKKTLLLMMEIVPAGERTAKRTGKEDLVRVVCASRVFRCLAGSHIVHPQLYYSVAFIQRLHI